MFLERKIGDRDKDSIVGTQSGNTMENELIYKPKVL